MKGVSDKRVEYINNIIQEYITAICCINDSFLEIRTILAQKKSIAIKSMDSFISNIKHTDNDDFIEILRNKPSYIKRFKIINKDIIRSKQAFNILPQSLFISIVSQFDVLIAQLIKFIYLYSENKLLESDNQISFREVLLLGDIDKIKEKFINDKIDSALRTSHSEQIKTLSKLIGDVSLDKVDFWSDFIEMTQRRNLFVHSKGAVSSQYISECKKAGKNVDVQIGEILIVDEQYFDYAFNVFFCMGVMLSQVISRVLLGESLLGEIDCILNNIIYETICEGKYDIAIRLSRFATDKNTKHSNKLDEKYFILNYAQAYKWMGNNEKCKEIITQYDFSETKEDILVAKYALEDDLDNVIKSMNIIGCQSEIMNEEAYATWEIFKEMRMEDCFQKTFEKIFQKPLYDSDATNIAEQTKEIIDKT